MISMEKEKNDNKYQTELMSSINEMISIKIKIENSWSKIAPSWPLKNIIAVNPLAGFEDLPFEEALKQAQAYYQQKDMPASMKIINRESIKWLQIFFDDGQSTIQMPLRTQGLLKSILTLIRFDRNLNLKNENKNKWLENLPKNPEKLIEHCLLYLGISTNEHEQFLSLMLTTLPGWAAYIKYRTQWPDVQDINHPYPVTQTEYLALRLVLTCLIWPSAKELLSWHQHALNASNISEYYKKIIQKEEKYRKCILNKLKSKNITRNTKKAKAQLIFCIDVRSEPFRRTLETIGDYETFGFAGFFGLPISIENAVTGDLYASCPVLLKPAHPIIEMPTNPHQPCHKGYRRLQGIKRIYQSVKYTFIAPFNLVEIIGLISGLWMGFKSFAPNISTAVKKKLQAMIIPDFNVKPVIQSIPLSQQIVYGASTLKMIGLIDNFSSLIVFCGHGSATQNNAHATALNCGACGGRHGGPNARVLAEILNTPQVRKGLKAYNIQIPYNTFFIAAEHNTTTDAIIIYDNHMPHSIKAEVSLLRKDLNTARDKNNLWRSSELGIKVNKTHQAKRKLYSRSNDWSQVRPEWGLARNASFIIGPRSLTKNINLEGRSFLHSYDWQKDHDGSILTTILTAPMVVAHWINAQYFFSTLDNVAFGGGSKITQNITGKFGLMQGNASDLMHGLPLQSLFKNDTERYHEPIRLTVIVYAPRSHITPTIEKQQILQNLFGNGWIYLICYEPDERLFYILKNNLAWSQVHH